MREVRRSLLEFMVVAAGCLLVGLVANAASSKGLSLTRNYFPPRRAAEPAAIAPSVPQPGQSTEPEAGGGESSTGGGRRADDPQAGDDLSEPDESSGPGPGRSDPGPPAAEDLLASHPIAQRLIAEGLSPIGFEEVAEMFRAPEYEMGIYVIIDARNDQHFADGHIPRALQLDYYYVENYIDHVLPFCQGASKIVIYCTGGDCEDSELAAIELRNRGIDPSKLHVFLGGIKEWKAQGMPIEEGA